MEKSTQGQEGRQEPEPAATHLKVKKSRSRALLSPSPFHPYTEDTPPPMTSSPPFFREFPDCLWVCGGHVHPNRDQGEGGHNSELSSTLNFTATPRPFFFLSFSFLFARAFAELIFFDLREFRYPSPPRVPLPWVLSGRRAWDRIMMGGRDWYSNGSCWSEKQQTVPQYVPLVARQLYH
jgi:hypothetical protein